MGLDCPAYRPLGLQSENILDYNVDSYILVLVFYL